MNGILSSLGLITATLPLAFAAPFSSAANEYDPLTRFPGPISNDDLTAHDAARDRDVPIRIYLPATKGAPVVLFSHGLGGTRMGSDYLGKHWAKRGYAAIFLQHPGSDDSVWKNVHGADRMKTLEAAITAENLVLRAQDVSFILTQLEKWNADSSSPLAGYFDLQHIGMSGHSFGAVTTQAVSGETLVRVGSRLTDPRIKAAIAFSPNAPSAIEPGTAFGSVTVPWMLMTGTKDIAPVGRADMKSRLAVYPALHGIPKYQVILNNAQHSAFIERALLWDREPRNPNHHRVILALSTAFWDTYLRGDADARRWLNGEGPHSIMESNDQWEFFTPRGS